MFTECSQIFSSFLLSLQNTHICIFSPFLQSSQNIHRYSLLSCYRRRIFADIFFLFAVFTEYSQIFSNFLLLYRTCADILPPLLAVLTEFSQISFPPCYLYRTCTHTAQIFSDFLVSLQKIYKYSLLLPLPVPALQRKFHLCFPVFGNCAASIPISTFHIFPAAE